MITDITQDINGIYTVPVYSEANKYLKITITDINDATVDLTGKTVYLYVRLNRNSANLISKTITSHLNQTTYKGQTYVNLTTTDISALDFKQYKVLVSYSGGETGVNSVIVANLKVI